MSRSVVFTDQHAPDGRTIRYNMNNKTRNVAALVENALQQDRLVEIPNEDGGEPIFVNPDRVATVAPAREDLT